MESLKVKFSDTCMCPPLLFDSRCADCPFNEPCQCTKKGKAPRRKR